MEFSHITASTMPNWISKKEKCLFCNKEIDLYTAYLSDDEKTVLVWYKCFNDHCDHYKIFHKLASYGISFQGNYAEHWKEFMHSSSYAGTEDYKKNKK